MQLKNTVCLLAAAVVSNAAPAQKASSASCSSASAGSGTATTSSYGFISTPHDLAGFVPIDPKAPAPNTPKNGYVSTGKLHKQEPMPYTPAGGIGTNNTVPPVYNPLSDFDFQSINLALNQEWIELDLFHNGLAKFSVADFEAAGLNAEDRHLIEFMANQEVGHAQLLTDILGPAAAKQCTYKYPYQTVREFIDFCQKLTRFGESGVYGFIEHLDSRPSAQLLLQSITTEARQQMIFRQFEGLFPMPVWFEVGVTQSMAWTLLAPYIHECPKENPHIVFQNFPALTINNNPNGTDPHFGPAITHNRTALSYPGRVVEFSWENPGKAVSYNNSYMTSTSAGAPKYVAWVNQLNTTYTKLENIKGNTGTTVQPGGNVFADDGIVNGTMFVALTDVDIFVTPFNLSAINAHIVAGPALYQSG